MKKVLIARNSADGVVASLLIQARFETCDPLFGGRADVFEELGIPLYSVGISAAGASFTSTTPSKTLRSRLGTYVRTTGIGLLLLHAAKKTSCASSIFTELLHVSDN